MSRRPSFEDYERALLVNSVSMKLMKAHRLIEALLEDWDRNDLPASKRALLRSAFELVLSEFDDTPLDWALSPLAKEIERLRSIVAGAST